jgi:catechol 2,3-dioxygenase-like lactoylglutathione lyase family enzyme
VVHVEALHHVTICVRDLDAARRFYGAILGLEEIERAPFDFPGAWYALGDRQLHLIERDDARSFRGTRGVDSRDAHFALRVSDFDAAIERLRANGCEIRESRVNVTPWSQLYVSDPDGNIVELNVDRL